MASYNRTIIVGNLTRGPEIRCVDGGGKAGGVVASA
jgi:single-stranded DNA-binding protein